MTSKITTATMLSRAIEPRLISCPSRCGSPPLHYGLHLTRRLHNNIAALRNGALAWKKRKPSDDADLKIGGAALLAVIDCGYVTRATQL
jgi:hypothetical protein